ncbi:MAG: caspase family protein [Bacteroidia bacterium]
MNRFLFLIFLLNGLNSYSQNAELLVQLGHSDRLKCVDFSSDGKYIMTAGNDQMIKLWQVNNGMLVRTFRGHKGMVYDAKLSADGKYIYSCSWDDKRFLKWDIATGKILKTRINFKSPATAFSLSSDGKSIAIVCDEGVLILRSSDFGLIKKIAIIEPVFVQFSSDNRLIYIANKEYQKEKFIVYDIGHNEVSKEFKTIYGPNSMWVANEKVVLTNYKEIVCFDIDTKEKIYSLGLDSIKISTSTISNNGKKITVGLENGKIMIVHLDSGNTVLEHAHTGIINGLKFSDGDQFLATASNDWTAKIFSMATGKVVKELKTQSEFIGGISLNSTGNHLAFASGHLETGNHIGVWNITRGKLFPYYSSEGVYDFFTSVAFSPKNKTIAAGNTNGKTNWYNFPKNGNSGNLSLGNSPVTCVAFTPNGKNIISGTKDGKLIFWRPDRNKNESIDADKEGIASIAMSINGTKIGVGTYDGKMLIYGYDSKSLIATINSHTRSEGYYDSSFVLSYGAVTGVSLDGNFAMTYSSIMGVAFSPDNDLVATCGGSWIKIFNASSGELVKHIKQNAAGFSCISFSTDGKYICSGGADFNVRLYEVAKGNLIKTFVGHQNEVRSVLFSQNQKYLISGSFDTQIKIWDIETGKEILSYIVLKGGTDYVISNPQGYYFATKGAAKVLSFRVGNEVFPFEQFDLKYNRPDIILDNISKFVYGESKDHPNVQLIKSYYAAYEKRLKRAGFTETQLGSDFHVPNVSVTMTGIPVSTKQPNLSFEIKASDNLYDLSNLNVWINDVPLYGIKGMPINGKSFIKICEVVLGNERNKITVSCTNTKGVESFKESFEIIYEGGAINYKTYFIGIGVSNYQDTSFNLKYSVKDVEDLAKTIREKYSDADILLLTDKQATKENILKLKEKLLKTGVNDKVIISLSGHGLLSKDLDFYYATYNMDFGKPEKKGLLYDDLEGLLDGIPARNKLLMVDACHSGELDKSESIEFADTILPKGISGTNAKGAKLILNKNAVGLENSFELMQELFSDVSKGNGSVVISAAGGKEYALESDKWNNGVFTYCVLNGLKSTTTDKNADGKISVTELKNYVSAEVQVLTAGRQKPTSRKENLDNDWGIW